MQLHQATQTHAAMQLHEAFRYPRGAPVYSSAGQRADSERTGTKDRGAERRRAKGNTEGDYEAV
jgi:hypothetical protein